MSSFELGTDGPRVIVVGYNGSDTAANALAYASGLARRQGSSLVIAFASPNSVLAAMGTTVDTSLAGVTHIIAQDMEHEVKLHLDGTGVSWRFVAGTGDPVQLLECVAKQVQADAVVVGHSRHQRRLVGSVAIRLVRSAKWPTIVVP